MLKKELLEHLHTFDSRARAVDTIYITDSWEIGDIIEIFSIPRTINIKVLNFIEVHKMAPISLHQLGLFTVNNVNFEDDMIEITDGFEKLRVYEYTIE